MPSCLIGLLAFALVSVAVPAMAQAPATKGGTFSLKLPLPQGYCALDSGDRGDREIIDIYGPIYAGDDQLLRLAVECDQLPFWRKRPLKLDAQHTRNAAVYVKSFESLADSIRQRMPISACESARKSSGQPENDSLANVTKRMSAALASFQKPGEERLVGVVHQDGAACHVLVVAHGLRGNGQPLWIIHVRATAVIQSRVLHFYETAQVQPGNEVAALERLTALAKEDVRRGLAANP